MPRIIDPSRAVHCITDDDRMALGHVLWYNTLCTHIAYGLAPKLVAPRRFHDGRSATAKIGVDVFKVTRMSACGFLMFYSVATHRGLDFWDRAEIFRDDVLGIVPVCTLMVQMEQVRQVLLYSREREPRHQAFNAR